jgi:hypothetical protein
VIYGALVSFQISSKMSKWLIPSRYYVSFPYGVYSADFLRPYRQQISSDVGTLLTYRGRSVREGEYLGFTFDAKDWLEFRRVVRKEGTGQYTSYIAPGEKYPKEFLPIEKRYSARFFTLDKIFSVIKLKGVREIELPWYHNVGTWDGYSKFLGSKDKLKRPEKGMVKHKEYSQIGEEYGEE